MGAWNHDNIDELVRQAHNCHESVPPIVEPGKAPLHAAYVGDAWTAWIRNIHNVTQHRIE